MFLLMRVNIYLTAFTYNGLANLLIKNDVLITVHKSNFCSVLPKLSIIFHDQKIWFDELDPPRPIAHE